MPDCPVPVVNWKALVLMKLYAGRAVDLQDAKSILAVHRPDSSEQERLITRAEQLGVGQEVRDLFGFTSELP